MKIKSDILKSMGYFLGGVGILLIGIALLMKGCHDNSSTINDSSAVDYEDIDRQIKQGQKELEKVLSDPKMQAYIRKSMENAPVEIKNVERREIHK